MRSFSKQLRQFISQHFNFFPAHNLLDLDFLLFFRQLALHTFLIFLHILADARDVSFVLVRIAKDPEASVGEFSQGVRVGPGTRMPRLPALYKPKKKWRLASQADALDYLGHAPDHEGVWRRNNSTLQAFEQQVLEVVHDQAARGQIIVLSEKEAKRTYPNLVIASLGAQRKEKAGGKVSARVLFDGTHGLSVNTRIRLRDQERAPIAADLKRSTREKAKVDELTFALSADVTEARRQVPIHPDDWHYLGCQVTPGSDVFVNTVGTSSIASAS